MNINPLALPQLLATLLLFSQSSWSAVTVTFEEVPGETIGTTDVRVAWNGSLAVSVGGSTETTATVSGTSNRSNLSLAGDYRLADLGTSSSTSLATLFPVRDAATTGSWGFSFESLRWSSNLVGGGSYQNPTLLLFNPLQQFFVLSDTNLSAVGADSFNNTLAWTADSVDGGLTPGDTISYNTIPELSCSLLLGLGMLTLAAKRRRSRTT